MMVGIIMTIVNLLGETIRHSFQDEVFHCKLYIEAFKAKIRTGTKQQFSFNNNRRQAQRTIYTQVAGVRPQLWSGNEYVGIDEFDILLLE